MGQEEVELSVGARKLKLKSQYLQSLLPTIILIAYSIYLIEYTLSDIRTKQNDIARHLAVIEEITRKHLAISEQTYLLLKQSTPPGMWR